MRKIDPSDAITHSPELVSENIHKLRELFPEAFTEEKIDFEVLKQLLGGAVDEREEKFGLNWHGKRRARQLALTPTIGTLRPCPNESVDWDTTQNLMIEGDNLEVLKLLQKSYTGKVKLIYIDPPYNTGKDFVYPDNFQDNIKNYLELTGQADGTGRKLSSNTEASGRFHTDWLNMMYPRLKLARNLLREDGVILISIDDGEVDNLRLSCHDIFGEENFIASMIWEKGRKNDAKFLSVGHEYVLIYGKSIATLRERKTAWREEKPGAREIWEKYLELRQQYPKSDKEIEAALSWWYSTLPKTHPSKKWSRYKRVDLNGPWRDRDISWPGGGGPRYDVLHPTTRLPCKVPEAGWRYSTSEQMKRMIKLGLVEFRADHTEPPFRKAHIRPLPDELEEAIPELEEESEETEEEFATQVRGSHFYKQSQVAVKYLRDLFGAKVFNNPKDHFELARLFEYVLGGDADAIVLDFFAGSGSTGQAVLEVTKASGKQHRFILVQLPEPLDPSSKDQKPAAAFCDQLSKTRTIAELTKERLRRAGKKLREENPMFAGDTGFRVFKLDSSNIHAWDPSPADLADALQQSIDHLRLERTEQDILFELLLKLGLDLTVPIEQKELAGHTTYSVGAGALMVCLSKSIDRAAVEPLAHGLVAWRNQIAPAVPTQFVFRDSGFNDDVAKTNLTAILEQNLPPEALAAIRSL